MTINTANKPTRIATQSVTRNENGRTQRSRAHLYFWIFATVSCLAFWVPLKNLIAFSLTHDYGSHIPLIGPICIVLVYVRRHKSFPHVRANADRKGTIIAGSSLFLLGLIFLLLSEYQPLSTEKLSFEILSLVILWLSAFVFCYGSESFGRVRFPLLLLLLLVPIPQFMINKTVFALQAGSSDVAYGLLKMLGVPVLKEGFVLRLPVVNLEVAKECSGIRSSMALLLSVLVAGEFLLRSSWRRLVLVISAIPILVFKNGVRIVTIYLLTAYVNPAFLHGWLHTSGGIVFYLLGLVALIPVAFLLMKCDGEKLTLSARHQAVRLTQG